MKKILFIVFLSIFCAYNTAASEIFGRISTNPNDLPSNQNNPPLPEEPEEHQEAKKVEGGAVIILPSQKKTVDQAENSQSKTIKVRVLGISHYKDGSLLRSHSHKIYIIQGQVKKYIANLKELQEYRGQAINEATDEELSEYQTREHLDGELVREKGDVKVYVIEQGKKRHILQLSEFLTHYAGQDIFNISREEMALY